MPEPAASLAPLILAIDIGSSSIRVSLFDAKADVSTDSEARFNYAFRTGSDGRADADADELITETVRLIDQVLAGSGHRKDRIAGVAVSTFWHNVLGVDREGHAVTPVFSWADTRSSAIAENLRYQLDEQDIHARTGCMLHPSYLPAKLLWIRQTQIELFNRVRHWVSVGEYLYLKLFGRMVCSISMASGTGLLDQHQCRWDPEMVQLVSLHEDQLSPLGDMDQPLVGLSADYSRRWPCLADVPWFPPLGDGACSNIGSGCCTPQCVAIMVGTSGAMRVLWESPAVKIPKGLWCYHADRRRFLLGGALSNGGLLFDWMLDRLRMEVEPRILEDRLSRMSPDSHGLTLLPFLAGERSPGWNGSARAAIVGLSLHHQPLEILRASMESVAYRFLKIAGLLRTVLPENERVIASGGALLNSPTWTQMMADVLGRPVVASRVLEASSRGAALMALEALGLIETIEAIPAPLGRQYEPDPEAHLRYQEGARRQDDLYHRLLD